MTRRALPPGLDQAGTRWFIVGFWALMGALETAKEFTSAQLTGADRGLLDAFIINFPWWFFWAPATVLVLWLANRWPVDRTPRLPAVLIHLFVSIVLATLHMAFVATITNFWVVANLRPTSLWIEQFQYWVSAYIVLDVLVYWMVLGAQHALVYRRRLIAGRIREAESRARAADLEAIASEARLQALRMELNPHFLFNSLNSVSGLVESGKGELATTMIARLSELLRRTLSDGKRTQVPLSEEIEMAERYLWIEQVRFGDRLTVDISVEPGVEEWLVPPLILQPLIENAVRHGAARQPGQVLVSVSARAEGADLELAVRDNGPGLSNDIKEGVGVSNVRNRLVAAYGKEATVSLDSPESGGTLAKLTIPRRGMQGEDGR